MSTVRESFDEFISDLHREAASKINNGYVTLEDVHELFKDLGAPPLFNTSQGTQVTVGVKSVTFRVSGNTRAEIEENLQELASGIAVRAIDSLELDLSNVEGLPEEGGEYSPGDTDDEIKATRLKIEQGLRNWLIAKRKANIWCDGGVNSVLEGLGIEELPEEKTYTLRRKVTAVWEIDVDGFDEADAKARADWPQDSDGEASEGMVIIKTLSDVIAAEEQN